MTITIQKGGVIVLPSEIKNKPGFKAGKRFDVVFSAGILNIVPEVPNTDDEYTPKQRKIIDAHLAEAEKDIKRGRVYGPYNNAKEMMKDFYRRHPKPRANKK